MFDKNKGKQNVAFNREILRDLQVTRELEVKKDSAHVAIAGPHRYMTYAWLTECIYKTSVPVSRRSTVKKLKWGRTAFPISLLSNGPASCAWDGVYMLFVNDRLVYIGKSSRQEGGCQERIKEHLREGTKKDVTHYRAIPCDSAELLEWELLETCRWHSGRLPKYNKQMPSYPG